MKDGFIFADLRKSTRYDTAFRTGIGRRETQQDAGYAAVCDSEVLALLCDGMGGMAGGEKASRAAAEKFAAVYESSGQSADCQWMEDAIEQADDLVFSLKGEDGEPLGAGTTLVAVHITGDMLSWVSAGDSRLYIVRGQHMEQITTDHNYFFQLDSMLRDGEINREQYRAEAGDGEALISYVGMGGLEWKDLSTAPFPLLPGDTLLLCTDGLYRTVSDQEICRSVCAAGTMEKAARQLEDTILAADLPEQDNYTYILIHLNGGTRA